LLIPGNPWGKFAEIIFNVVPKIWSDGIVTASQKPQEGIKRQGICGAVMEV
jgi:hypothetical protein